MNKDYPPRGEQGFVEFISDAWTPYIGEIARRCEPVSNVKHYRFSRNRRRRWEKLERRPRGFIPIGDAIACFNPIYGQGMSVAAYEARALRQTIATWTGTSTRSPSASRSPSSSLRVWRRARASYAATDIPWP